MSLFLVTGSNITVLKPTCMSLSESPTDKRKDKKLPPPTSNSPVVFLELPAASSWSSRPHNHTPSCPQGPNCFVLSLTSIPLNPFFCQGSFHRYGAYYFISSDSLTSSFSWQNPASCSQVTVSLTEASLYFHPRSFALISPAAFHASSFAFHPNASRLHSTPRSLGWHEVSPTSQPRIRIPSSRSLSPHVLMLPVPLYFPCLLLEASPVLQPEASPALRLKAFPLGKKLFHCPPPRSFFLALRLEAFPCLPSRGFRLPSISRLLTVFRLPTSFPMASPCLLTWGFPMPSVRLPFAYIT